MPLSRSIAPLRIAPLRIAPLLLLVAATPVVAQSASGRDSIAADSGRRAQALGTVRVTVTRDLARSPFELPFAAARLSPERTRPALRRVGVGELLLGAPGVVVQDRANPSQDPRLAVRGFGARSAFGVRGVKLLRDGVPLSLPDGQTPLDWLDLETIGTLDVVRGTAAALYGNAAGGVIDFRTREVEQAPVSASLRAWNGGGLRRTNAQLSGAAGAAGGWLASVTRTSGDGARQWSRLDASSIFARGYTLVGGTRLELQGTHYDAPRAENTGALTAAELARDPRLPDSLNIQRRSRKAASQTQLSLLASRRSEAGELVASVFAGRRSLDNPLPFAIVGVERDIQGGSLRAARRVTRVGGAAIWPLRVSGGVDVQWQDDARGNWENCADVPAATPASVRCPTVGAERGAVRLDQREEVSGQGAFARAEVEAPGNVFASAAIRHDVVRFRTTDRFITASNADDSGERTLRAWSPMVGVAWRARPLLSLYANAAGAFETPTITELTNQANGAAGLNTQLEPQRTTTVEVGTQSVLFGRVRADVALFDARVRDELVSFDVPNQPGRRAFRNAGRTSRRGVEAALQGSVAGFDAGAAYTWSRFRFEEYRVAANNYAGKPIPGIPARQLQSYVTYTRRGVFGTADVTAVSDVTADDGATVHASGYAVWGARVGYNGAIGAIGAASGRLRIEPMLGVENLLDRRFASSVVVNATRGRYFEPGLPRRVVGSVRIGVR